MQESYRQALGGIYPVPVLFFAKALYAMRESVILGMGQRRKPQEKEGTKQMKFDMHCHTKEGSMDGKVPIDDFIAELIREPEFFKYSDLVKDVFKDVFHHLI